MKKKYIPPQKRMKKYKDFGYNSFKDSITKIKFTKFAIIVPSKKDKEEIQSCMEYLHNMKELDTEFVIVNQVVHEYNTGEDFSRIVVDKELYKKLKMKD